MVIQHLRIARPTDRLGPIVAFYRDLFDFEIICAFDDHEGFDGVMLGRDGHDFHLEFTHERGTSSERQSSPEHLIVFYFEEEAWNAVRRRLDLHGVATVPSYNPYWNRHGVTIQDPDGTRIVLHRGPWRPALTDTQ